MSDAAAPPPRRFFVGGNWKCVRAPAAAASRGAAAVRCGGKVPDAALLFAQNGTLASVAELVAMLNAAELPDPSIVGASR